MPRLLTDVLILLVVASICTVPAFFAVRGLVEIGLFGDPERMATGLSAASFGFPFVWIFMTAYAMALLSKWRIYWRNRR